MHLNNYCQLAFYLEFAHHLLYGVCQ